MKTSRKFATVLVAISGPETVCVVVTIGSLRTLSKDDDDGYENVVKKYYLTSL